MCPAADNVVIHTRLFVRWAVRGLLKIKFYKKQGNMLIMRAVCACLWFFVMLLLCIFPPPPPGEKSAVHYQGG